MTDAQKREADKTLAKNSAIAYNKGNQKSHFCPPGGSEHNYKGNGVKA